MERDRLLIATKNFESFKNVADQLETDFEVCRVEDGWRAIEEMRGRSIHGAILSADMEPPGPFDVLSAVADRIRPRDLAVIVADSKDHVRAQTAEIQAFIVGLVTVPLTEAGIGWAGQRLLDILWSRRLGGLGTVEQQIVGATQEAMARLFTPDADVRTAYQDTVQAAGPLADAVCSGGMDRLLDILRHHHAYSFAHSVRVGVLLGLFGQWVGFSQDDIRLVTLGGLVHDIGKRNLPVGLLDKPGRLDAEEMAVMQKHPVWSREVLTGIGTVPGEVIRIAERHHEKLDGTGYPHGLRASQIDDLSLVSAVVDVFVALTEKRAYKRAMTSAEALEIMMGMRGGHLETGFVDQLARLIEHRAL